MLNPSLLLLASEIPETAPEGLWALIALGVLWMAVWIKICGFLVYCAEKLPKDSRSRRPWVTYMLMIPGPNLIFNFYVLIGLSNAYLRAYDALGRDLPVRESARTEAIVFSSVMATAWYPMESTLLAILWMAGMGAIILYLFKLHSLSQRFDRIQR
jgi:hypothetical protein